MESDASLALQRHQTLIEDTRGRHLPVELDALRRAQARVGGRVQGVVF
jgi:hypothetical protein